MTRSREIKDLPENLLAAIYHFLTGIHNSTEREVNELILKPALSNVFVIFIAQYGILSICGIVLNIYIIYYIIRHKLYRDVTHAFMVNLCVCHFVQCAFVLPITLLLILTQNWIFGQFMCYFIPLLQDIPLHVAIITHLLIAWDRMRWLGDPLVARFPSFVSCCATWLSGMVIALPYPIYTTFLDLGMYIKEFQGVGICIVNLVDDMQEYTRGLFIIMYCAPATILAYLYIRTAREMRSPEGPIGTVMFEHCADVRIRQRCSTSSSNRSEARTNYTRSYDLYDAEMDITREKRTQRYLGAMASTQIISTCPLMILRIARMILVETYENTANFDITYLMFVWIAFLPTVIFPCVYASWILSRPAKERLRRYFRLSSRQSESENKLATHRSTENSVTQENTTETLEDPIDGSCFNEKSANFNLPDRLSVEKPVRKTNHKHSNRNLKKKIANDMDRSMSASNYTVSNKIKAHSENVVRDVDIPADNRECIYFGSQHELLNLNQDQLSNISDKPLTRRESSSTYERDMEIIDLLQRDRSMDLKSNYFEREMDVYPDAEIRSINKNTNMDEQPTSRPPSFERRKLPDISKITAPNMTQKPVLTANERSNFPNLVFTHQQQNNSQRKIKYRNEITAPIENKKLKRNDINIK